MTTAIILLRARLKWVKAKIAKERARKDSDSRQKLITGGRVDAWSQDEAWLVFSIRQLEAEQEAGIQ